ncbi:L-threonylcarbamoyladenylate synthase [Thiomonas intermedia]|uniref:L-threonylcarbamoyladenylate synthase n=1 Tax=Thiomonas intermedia TaxID=926 RepID=UPI0009A52785|nr:L-threonylcarbamoyladenylate synthase [Thiomonas intermedia]
MSAVNTDAQVRPREIVEAVRRLEAGELVGLPTETVYGLAADAENPEAVAKIYAAKGRPADHPVIVHVHRLADLGHWAAEVPETARQLAAAFWPGPLTLILPRKPGVAQACAGGQDTIGLRCPSHPVAQAVLAIFKGGQGGLAAPSANRFGRISPTTAAHVQAELGHDLLVLDGGACAVGIESTIVDCTVQPPRILRPGLLQAADLAAVLGVSAEALQRPADDAPRVAGALPAHYAPRTALLLRTREQIHADLAQANDTRRIGVLARHALEDGISATWMQLPDDPAGYAQRLYAALRELDQAGLDQIWVEALPPTQPWLALRDRLSRAARGSGAPGN